jgi:hypothetical protein
MTSTMRMLNKIVPKMYMNKIFIIIKLKMKGKKNQGEWQIKKKDRSQSAQ